MLSREQGCSIFLISLLSLYILTLVSLIPLVAVIPQGVKSLNLVDSGVINGDQDHFLHIYAIKQTHPFALGRGVDIPVTLEARNAGKLPLTPRRMWLEFMQEQIWISIPELEPGDRFSLQAVLPYPSRGAIHEDDKFVKVAVDSAHCNILGFHIDIETFSHGVYRKTSDKLIPDLNVLAISTKSSVIVDLLDGIRALEPLKYNNLRPRPVTEEALVGTSLQPLFALQVWEAASVELLEKNRFYFENLINGTWREHTLYSLDNHLLKRDVYAAATRVNVVLFAIPNDIPSEVIRGVTATWKAAEAANKRPLLLIINGSSTEEAAAKFSVPSCDILCHSLNQSHQSDVRILQTLHKIILRGENVMRSNSSYVGNTRFGDKSRTVLSACLLLLLISLLIHGLCALYSEVRCFPARKKTIRAKTVIIPQKCGQPSPLPAKDRGSDETLDTTAEPRKELADKKSVLDPEMVTEPTNAQGTFTCAEPEALTPTKIAGAEPINITPPGSAENDRNTSVIYIEIERLIEKTTQEDYESDSTMDDEQEFKETSTHINNMELSINEAVGCIPMREAEAHTDAVAEGSITDTSDISVEDFEELIQQVESEREIEAEIDKEEADKEAKTTNNEQQVECKMEEAEETVEDIHDKENDEINKVVELLEEKILAKVEEKKEEAIVETEEKFQAAEKVKAEETTVEKKTQTEEEVHGVSIGQQSNESLPEQVPTLLTSHIDIIENYASSSFMDQRNQELEAKGGRTTPTAVEGEVIPYDGYMKNWQAK